MSHSPPPHWQGLSNRKQEELINAYEAEEERIINVLSRKLEQVRSSLISFFFFL
jgi:hypothetical protein